MILTADPDGSFQIDGRRVRCALGRGGVADAEAKVEGDGATPAGVWPLRRLLFRPDRGVPPPTRLPSAPIAPDDGWCDAPGDPRYNRQVTLPYPASAERLWREDHLYDLLVVLGHNDAPVVQGAGSAIFLHLATDGFAPTEGCVALARADLIALLERAGPGDCLEITARSA
jgi:L,D-peptidoglycan transpeptidase YkuD (ErfK/YbiS/YcfS/YnhG family)